MRGLYLRVAGSGALAIVVSSLTVQMFLAQFRGRFDPRVAGGRGGPIEWIANQLDQLPTGAWPARLAEAQREMATPLSVVRADALPEGAAAQLALPRPMLVDTGRGGPSMYVPVRGGTYYVVAAPPAPPPPLPLIAGASVFVCVLTLSIAATVGIPLVRRLQVLRRAIVELGNGTWTVRELPEQGGMLSELAESIRRTATRLQRQFEEREALLQLASHEIGTPLARMRFQLGMLEEQLSSGRDRARLRAMDADLDELDTLSADLVGWMETDRESRTCRAAVQVAPLLRSLAELEQSSNGGRVGIDVRMPQDATVWVDQRQFQRAVENVMRNAFRYAQSRVVVEVGMTHDSVAVDVRDDGPGIPPEQRNRVLEPFVRVDSVATRAHRGLGLGLAIVRRIVDAHGGEVEISAAAEGGTCVRTVWPRTVASVEGATQARGQASEGGTQETRRT